jgi:hypothetical protein
MQVRYLEHVQCRISLKYFPRGQLHILLRFAQHRAYVEVVYCVIIILPCANTYSITLLLRSPRGTQSFLLLTRPKDRQASGILYNYTLTCSLKFWPHLFLRVKSLQASALYYLYFWNFLFFDPPIHTAHSGEKFRYQLRHI